MSFARPQVARLPGNRLHLQHGPIDLVIRVEGKRDGVEQAYDQANRRFASVLEELVGELGMLRALVEPKCCLETPVAQRMWRATVPFAAHGLTPMAAVAGSVADEIVHAMVLDNECISRAFVNNGGDIAIWNTTSVPFEIATAVADDWMPANASFPATISVGAADQIGGVVTSGWRGRSYSLGIADAVTVLADSAASADAAATVIANTVDVEAPSIERCEARKLDPDSDLGQRLVTVCVGKLTQTERASALDQGARLAQHFCTDNTVNAVLMLLQGDCRVVGSLTAVRYYDALAGVA